MKPNLIKQILVQQQNLIAFCHFLARFLVPISPLARTLSVLNLTGGVVQREQTLEIFVMVSLSFACHHHWQWHFNRAIVQLPVFIRDRFE